MKTLSSQNEAFNNSKTLVSFYKYHELADGDNDFLLLLLQQTLIEFQNTKIKYPELVEKKDVINLGKLVHKIKPTLILFGLNDFLNEIQVNRDLLSNNGTEVEIQDSTNKLSIVFDKIIEELEQKILEVKILLI